RRMELLRGAGQGRSSRSRRIGTAGKRPLTPERALWLWRGRAGRHPHSAHYGWAGSGDASRSRDEMRALEVLGLESDADFDAVRKAWRAKAKEVHPDLRPGDAEAAKAFQALQLA